MAKKKMGRRNLIFPVFLCNIRISAKPKIVNIVRTGPRKLFRVPKLPTAT